MTRAKVSDDLKNFNWRYLTDDYFEDDFIDDEDIFDDEDVFDGVDWDG